MAVPTGIGAVRERRLGDHTAIQYVAKAFGKGTVFAILTVLFAPIPYAIIEFSDAQYVGSKEPAQFWRMWIAETLPKPYRSGTSVPLFYGRAE